MNILDEDHPLADVPVTGDMVLAYNATDAASGAGLLVVSRKRKKK